MPMIYRETPHMGRRLLGLLVVVASFLATAAAPSPAVAAPVEARVQLHDGKLATTDLSRVLLDNFHLHGLSLNVGTIDMSGLEGTAFIHALNTALAGGGSVHVEPDALVLSLDASKLPHDIRAAKHDLEVFTATVAPQATARQRRFYGLLMPQKVDANRPMVVLVHGLDCDRTNWFPMADLLIGQGYQVAYFTYPSDGPLADSGAMLAKEMTALHEEFPTMTLDIVAHSMGGLVARDYVEGDRY